jgi:hypothetical protein
MPKLYLNGWQAFEELIGSRTALYIVYAMAALIVFGWIVICFKQAKGLANHHNAVGLRNLESFMRAADPTVKQTDELFGAITKNKNDIAMLFLVYCRIYDNFNNIKYYLNYKTYKKLDKRRKPWAFTSVIAVVLLVTLAVSILHFDIKGLTNLESVLIAVAAPIGLLLVWLLCLMLAVLKYKMYWIEFENLFRKVHEISGTFFISQSEYYDEFAANILNIEPTKSSIKRRIERMIAKTDPNEKFNVRPYAARPPKPEEERQQQPASHNMPEAKNFQQMPVMPTAMPMMPGVRVLKPHPETEAYMQAQAQITQQLMQMMMQQSLQQAQVMQRALTSQQALANSVVQQNILAMRLEAQQAALKRPDFGKYTPPWMTEGLGVDENARKSDEEEQELAAPAKDQSTNTTATAEVAPPPKPKNAELVERLKRAFEFLSPPPKESPSEPDPIFPAPGRDKKNIEKRLGQFFTGTVYVYDE